MFQNWWKFLKSLHQISNFLSCNAFIYIFTLFLFQQYSLTSIFSSFRSQKISITAYIFPIQKSFFNGMLFFSFIVSEIINSKRYYSCISGIKNLVYTLQRKERFSHQQSSSRKILNFWVVLFHLKQNPKDSLSVLWKVFSFWTNFSPVPNSNLLLGILFYSFHFQFSFDKYVKEESITSD